ncbi:unnamed protein product, partial [Cyprideis torosa]
EAPGAEEDRRGEAFVGRAGQLLEQMLAAINLSRDEVYITNVLKCRPPSNRDPKGEEVVACRRFLLRQVQLVEPELIVALGRFAAQVLLDRDEAISRLRGEVHRETVVNAPVLVTYHPAYLLRNPIDKARGWDDLKAEGDAAQAIMVAMRLPNALEILELWVAPAYRRQGRAGLLLGALFADAARLGQTQIRLEVRAGNTAAIATYQSAGFVKDGLRRRYYRDPPDDALLMSCGVSVE